MTCRHPHRAAASLRGLGLVLLLSNPVLICQSPLSIELRDGEDLVGTVVEVSEETVRVDVGYPEPTTRTLARDRIEPRSMFAILAERVDPSSADGLRRLARAAAGLDLPGHAIATLRAASRVDEAGKAADDREIARLREEIADRLVERAREAAEAGRFPAARLEARFVARHFGETDARDAALEILDGITEARTTADDVERIGEEDVRALVEDVRYELARGQAAGTLGTAGSGIDSDRRERLETAIRTLERLWQPLRDRRADPAVPAEPRAELEALRQRVRDRLVAHYVALGELHVQIDSLPEAADLNEKASALLPDSPAVDRLQDRIVQARIHDGRRF